MLLSLNYYRLLLKYLPFYIMFLNNHIIVGDIWG